MSLWLNHSAILETWGEVMNAAAFVELCKAFAWPLSVVYLAHLFRTQLRDVVTRLITAKLPGGTEFTFGSTPADRRSDRAKMQSNTPDIRQGNWSKSGNLYWLGHDLMWIRDALLRGGNKAALMYGLAQANHHIRALGLEDSNGGKMLVQITQKVESSLDSDLNHQFRASLDLDLANLIKRIGVLTEENQTDFDPGPAFK
jgi:hypothetical protein